MVASQTFEISIWLSSFVASIEKREKKGKKKRQKILNFSKLFYHIEIEIKPRIRIRIKAYADLQNWFL